MIPILWCEVHLSNGERDDSRCYYSRWADALDRCLLVAGKVTIG